jgi:hypothetical protein
METNPHMPRKVRCVGVTLHDNDFHVTFENILMSLKNLSWWSSETLTEEEIKSYILDAIPFFYKHYQCHGRSSSLAGYEQVENITKYLNSRLKIFFNEEAEAYFAKGDHNSEYRHWDFTLGELFEC